MKGMGRVVGGGGGGSKGQNPKLGLRQVNGKEHNLGKRTGGESLRGVANIKGCETINIGREEQRRGR